MQYFLIKLFIAVSIVAFQRNLPIMAAIIYNALIIVALIPLALRGVKYREASSQSLLSRNLLVYGLGGIVLPFVVIKLLDMMLTALGVA